MKRYGCLLILLLCLALCVGAIWLLLRSTAEYPTLGEAVSYPINQVEGIELTIEEPTYSPFKGYTIHWAVTADTEEVYTFTDDGPGFEYLETLYQGQWYRLSYTQENFPFNNLAFTLGGEEGTGLEGSIVQKYAYYGTRLAAGTYRVVLEMTDKDETPYYLAAEFTID